MEPARIGIRRLRESLSEAIRRVRAGETLEVTDRGQPVARIVPIAEALTGFERLIAEGKLIPAKSHGPLPPPLELPSIMTSEEAIDILRGE